MSEKNIVSIVKSDLPVDRNQIDIMVKSAIDLVGGIEQLVKKGDTVVVKPNIFAPYPPPVSVDRRVVGAVVALCRAAGAARVIVLEGVSVGSLMKRVNVDASHSAKKLVRGMKTVDMMRLLGVKETVEEVGGEVFGVEDAETVKIDVPDGKVLHTLDYPKAVLEADVLINIPALKTHTMTFVTLGIKNLQGILTERDRYYGHRDDLDQHLVDILKVRKPDLTLVDGLIGMEGMGAGESGTPLPMGLVLAGTDVVAVDSVCTRVMGIENPLVVSTTRIAAHDGLGTANPFLIEVVGQSVESVMKKFQLPINFVQPLETLVTGVYPNVDVYIGGACPSCWLMSAGVLAQISKIKEGASLIVGADPKIPPGKDWDLENTFFLGDCAIGCAGDLRDLRNEIALAGHDTFLYGCLPYQQANVKLENMLIERGLVERQELIEKAKASRKKLFEYYQEFDPTWKPEL
ncbi:MAG: DUF362 domain-containing protein [Proteobacteria bacterium]|nr:DUF362 domain-containing protein [Pseudomonadota bacterium]